MEMNSVLNSPLERNKRQDSTNALNNRRRKYLFLFTGSNLDFIIDSKPNKCRNPIN